MSHDAWVNLPAVDSERLEVQTDICIVGAGAAGAFLARDLATRGTDVLLVEAGATPCVDAETIEFQAEFSPAPYPGAVSGRMFGLGGSTSRWGGLLAPHSRFDVRDRPDAGVWEWIVNVVAEEAPAVLGALGYPAGPDFDTFPAGRLPLAAFQAIGTDFHIQAGLYLPFPRKNLATLIPAMPFGSCRVIHGAVAKQWTVEPGAGGARLAGMVAESRNGRRVCVRARRFVIAAGAIESARILLEIDRSTPRPVLPPSCCPGRYLADHLSVAIADANPLDRGGAADLFAPWFTGPWMHGFRFLERGPGADAPRCFLHFIFDNENPGFLLAKEVLVAMQGRQFPKLAPGMVVRGFGGLFGLAYGRYARSRLFIPRGTPVRLQLDIEQPPRRGNAITLSDRFDAYGRRVPHIHWSVSEEDRRLIEATTRRLLGRWPRGAGLPRLEPRSWHADGIKPHDAYHPVGTCRMADGPDGVVDRELRVNGIDNAWVASTAVLPGAGTANPTFTLLCLANRLSRRLASP
jgi:choline dehydrogenase-like flavoprotein